MSAILKIAITTGDPDGIGVEVTKKALQKVSLAGKVQLFIFICGEQELKNYPKSLRHKIEQQKFTLLGLLNEKFTVFHVGDLATAMNLSNSYLKSCVFVIESNLNPAIWVEQSARFALNKKLSGLVTAPLSKTLIQRDGLRDMGHTDILKRVCKSKNAFMSFWGKHFNVVLITGHLPLQKVNKALNVHLINDCVKESTKIVRKLKIKNKLAIVGLNPHAGEAGLIGSEEIALRRSLRGNNHLHSEFLVPDVAFQQSNWRRFSAYLCPYHDQGLIPFKMIHGQQSGAHLTLGIPIVRTSVDHGTAKDIFAKNIATPNSMIDALKLCINLCKAK